MYFNFVYSIFKWSARRLQKGLNKRYAPYPNLYKGREVKND